MRTIITPGQLVVVAAVVWALQEAAKQQAAAWWLNDKQTSTFYCSEKSRWLHVILKVACS